jgi:hypothetical protein
LGAGIKGSRIAHASSVKSLGYALRRGTLQT